MRWMMVLMVSFVFVIYACGNDGSTQDSTSQRTSVDTGIEELTGLDRSARMLATIHDPSNPKNPQTNKDFKQFLDWISKHCQCSYTETADRTVFIWQDMKDNGVRGESLLETMDAINTIIGGFSVAYRQYASEDTFPPKLCVEAIAMYGTLRENGQSSAQAQMGIISMLAELLKAG